jgi:hypothetical protein
MGLEVVIRPYSAPDTGPTPFHPAGASSAPPVRLTVGLVGGTKTFAFSQSGSISTYMAAIHKEKAVTAFDMTTGKVAQ